MRCWQLHVSGFQWITTSLCELVGRPAGLLCFEVLGLGFLDWFPVTQLSKLERRQVAACRDAVNFPMVTWKRSDRSELWLWGTKGSESRIHFLGKGRKVSVPTAVDHPEG